MKNRLLFSLFLLLSTPALAAPTRIAGEVINDSARKPASGALIEVVRAREGSTPTLLAKTRSNAQGKFAFVLPNIARDDLLIARCHWSGHIYVAPAYDGGAKLQAMGVKLNPQNLKLRVFDTTTRLVPLSFLVHHLAIESEAGGLKCTERIVVENPTRKVFLGLGERRATVLLSVPPNAKNVRLDEQVVGAKLEKRPDGWAVIKPIAPNVGGSGERNLVVIHYELPWPSALPWERKLDLSRKVQYPTKFFFVAREDDDKKLQIIAPKLGKDQQAPLEIEGRSSTRWINSAGQPMPGQPPILGAGDDLKIEIRSPVEPLFWGFAAFVVALCAAVPLLVLRRTRGDSGSSKIEEPTKTEFVYGGTFTPDAPQFSSQSQGLIERIARLDEEYSAGAVEPQQYQAQRAAWKQELVEQLSQPSPSQHNSDS